MKLPFSRNTRTAILIYLFATAVYASVSGARLRHRTDDNHFVWLGHGWLHGRLDLGQPPPHSNDWAQIEWLHLKDGRVVKGGLVSGTAETYRTLRGEIVRIPPDEIERRETKYYVSFPPFPAVVMLPFVAIWGLDTNDVLFSVLLAGMAPALLFLLLRRLAARGDSRRTEAEDLWLTAVLGLGSVYFYTSVIGQVWYTAHVVAVVLEILFIHFSLDAKRPFLAGAALAFGFATRPQILYAAPLFLWELVRVHMREEDDHARALAAKVNQDLFAFLDDHRRWIAWPLAPLLLLFRIVRRAALHAAYVWHRLDKGPALGRLVQFGLPVAAVGLTAAYLNYVRFGRPTEFGHTYLAVRWAPRIQKFGLFNYTFLGRNLTCLLALTPRIIAGPPYIQYSWHGLALWVTTPVVLYLLWPRVKGALHRPLWLTTAFVAVPSLIYQNSGWVQFGYRFSLDYMAFLICLLAIGDRPVTRWFKVLVIVGIVVNLFGAITFGRMPQFSFDGYFPGGID